MDVFPVKGGASPMDIVLGGRSILVRLVDADTGDPISVKGMVLLLLGNTVDRNSDIGSVTISATGEGRYTAPRSGTFELTVVASGFEEALVSGVVVEDDRETVLRVPLRKAK